MYVGMPNLMTNCVSVTLSHNGEKASNLLVLCWGSFHPTNSSLVFTLTYFLTYSSASYIIHIVYVEFYRKMKEVLIVACVCGLWQILVNHSMGSQVDRTPLGLNKQWTLSKQSQSGSLLSEDPWSGKGAERKVCSATRSQTKGLCGLINLLALCDWPTAPTDSHPSVFNFASLWVIAGKFRVLVVKPEALGSTMAAPHIYSFSFCQFKDLWTVNGTDCP